LSDDVLAGIEWTGLEYHSGRVQPGDVFFAFAGAKTDGTRFALEAVGKGAVAVISESPPPASFPVRWIQVEHGRRTLAELARRRYASTAASLTLTGVTGTNGKSTTCALIDSIHRAAGRVTAMVGTISYEIAGETRPSINTTPESLDLYRLFEEAVGRGAAHATMEVSSHGLALGRVWAMAFHTTVFTNLTQDHLDFHPSMEDYFRAKCLLFEGQGAPPPRVAVLNADDEWARRIPVAGGQRVIRYGTGAGADLRACKTEVGFDGLRFDLAWEGQRWPVRSSLTGLFNVYNILAAAGAGLGQDLDVETILRGIAARDTVPGRFERVDEGQPFLVVVDYAHTPDALRNVLAAARKLAGHGRVICLFGCGGDRDRGKRPLMGQAAGELSDLTILTSDNPRGEDPIRILNDALVGLQRANAEYRVEPDRGKAIRLALAQARPGDALVLAGKGHETYQVLRGETIHFDDREEARAALRQAGFLRRAE